MKLEIVSGLISFVGKTKEFAKAERELIKIREYLEITLEVWFDNGGEDELDLGFTYDMDQFSVEDCKDAWRRVKRAS